MFQYSDWVPGLVGDGYKLFKADSSQFNRILLTGEVRVHLSCSQWNTFSWSCGNKYWLYPNILVEHINDMLILIDCLCIFFFLTVMWNVRKIVWNFGIFLAHYPSTLNIIFQCAVFLCIAYHCYTAKLHLTYKYFVNAKLSLLSMSRASPETFSSYLQVLETISRSSALKKVW